MEITFKLLDSISTDAKLVEKLQKLGFIFKTTTTTDFYGEERKAWLCKKDVRINDEKISDLLYLSLVLDCELIINGKHSTVKIKNN